jgi:hypothetical protein
MTSKTTDTALGQTNAERQESLHKWGFTCKCAFCTQSPDKIAISDMNRERLYEIHGILTNPSGLNSEDIDEIAEELIQLINEEELWPQLVTYYEALSRAYMQASNFKSAWRYAELTDSTWIQYGGDDHENIDNMRLLWQELKEAMK